jgi:glucose-1-phosphate cytidylyltransferase
VCRALAGVNQKLLGIGKWGNCCSQAKENQSVKAVILAGGLGSRLSEETSLRPKPMVEIGGKPILWHIMKIYSAFGINDFIICLGYKGYLIKKFFADYFLYSADVTIDLASGKTECHKNGCEPWRVTLVDTGADTMTGGRLRRVLPYLKNEEMFCFTYGDGVADVNVAELLEFHKQHGKLVTLTAAQPSGKFGALKIDNDGIVSAFAEKPKGDGRWVNGGFFVLSPKIAAYLKDDSTVWEREPLETISREGNVMAYKHSGFWQPMDTIHDKAVLEELWNSGSAPWKVW